jgi:hypothetical protein
MQRAHHRRRPGAQRCPAETAGLARQGVAARQHAAVDGGVGGDHAGDAMRAHRRDHGGQGIVGEVGRDLQQQRSRGDAGGAGEAAILVLHGGEQRRELRLGLQVAQTGRVRRADVEDEIVGEAVQRAQARAVVVRGALERRGLRLAEVDAERHRRPSRGEPRRQRARHRVGAVVVEAQAVDQRVLGRQPEEAGRRVPGLGQGGDGAELGEAETERGPDVRKRAVLVEAGGEPERVRERESPEFLGEQRIAGGGRARVLLERALP